MEKMIKQLGLLLITLLPGTAFAIDMEFYTYNGFDTVVNAFTRLALIFSDINFTTIFFSFAVLGIVIGGSLAALKGLSGQQTTLQSWFFPILIGMALFQGLMLPKGNITVYDPVQNQFQIVADVPVAVIIVAGTFNLIERTIQRVVDTASAYPYADEAGGITFELLMKATSEELKLGDHFLEKTIKEYIINCAPVAMASSSTTVSEQSLKHGTNDLRAELAKMNLLNVYTNIYNASNKQGLTSSCKNTWDLAINPFLNDADFINVTAALCAKAGFKIGSSTALASCESKMQTAMEKFGITTGTFNATHFVRNIYLAQSIDKAMQDSNPDTATQGLANRNIMVQGIGVATAANTWLPQLRAIMTAVALGMIPILALFIITPLVGKVVLFTVGLFGWLTLWGSIDIIMHQMAMDGAAAFFERQAELKFSLSAIYMTPNSTAQALAFFGKIQTYSIMIASVIAMAIFKFGGYAMAQMSQNLGQQIESAGAGAAMATQTPEGRAQTMQGLTGAMGTEALRSRHDPMTQAQHQVSENSMAIGSTNQMMSLASQAGQSPNSVMNTRGDIAGGQKYGDFNALQNTAKEQGVPEGQLMAEQAGIQAMQKFGNTQNIGDMADYMKDHIQQKHGYEVADSAIYSTMAQLDTTGQWARLMATDGGDNANAYTQLMADNERMNISELATVIEKGRDFGMSPESIGETLGLMRAGENFAKESVLEQVGIEGVTLGHYANNLQYAHQGMAIEAVAEKAGMSTSELIGHTKEIGANRDLASFMNMDKIANTFDTDIANATLMQAGTNNSLTMSGADTVDKFIAAMPENHFSPAQESFMREHANEGIVFGYSFDPTDSDGGFINTSIKSGSEVYHKESAHADMSESLNAGTTMSAGTIHGMLGGSLTEQADSAAWGHATGAIIDSWDGKHGQDKTLDGQPVANVLQGVDEMYAPFGSGQMTASDTSSIYGGAGGGVGTGNIPGVNANLSGGTKWTTQEDESIRYSMPTYMMMDAVSGTLEKADSYLEQSGFDLNTQDSHEINQINNYRAEQVQDVMQTTHDTYMDFLQERGIEQLNNSDIQDLHKRLEEDLEDLKIRAPNAL